MNFPQGPMTIWNVITHQVTSHVFDTFNHCVATVDTDGNVRIWRDIDGEFFIAQHTRLEPDGSHFEDHENLLRQMLDRYICRVIKV